MRASSEHTVALHREVAALQSQAARRRDQLDQQQLQHDNATSSSSSSSSDNALVLTLESKLAAKAEACIALKAHVSFLSSQLARHIDEQVQPCFVFILFTYIRVSLLYCRDKRIKCDWRRFDDFDYVPN